MGWPLTSGCSGRTGLQHSFVPVLAWKTWFSWKKRWWQFPVIEFPLQFRGWVRARWELVCIQGCTVQSVLCPPVPKPVSLALLSPAAGAGCIMTPGKILWSHHWVQCPNGITGLWGAVDSVPMALDYPTLQTMHWRVYATFPKGR